MIVNSLTIVAVWTLILDWICSVDDRGVWNVRLCESCSQVDGIGELR